MAINMSDFINPDRSIAEMLMLHEVDNTAVFIYVEGRDDIKLISRMVKPDVHVGFCKGKKKVCELMRKIENNSRLKNVVAIVDKDYDELLYGEPTIENLFYTDGTDMESSILKVDKALQKVMLEYSDQGKVNAYNSSHIPELIQKVYDICSQVGRFRLTNQKYDIGLKFKGIEITDYIDQDLNFDFIRYQDAVICNTERVINTDSVKSKVNAESKTDYAFWEICRGHDLVQVLHYVFSTKCLSYGQTAFDEKELARFLRGAYEEQWFTRTSMYLNLKNWQARKHVELLNVV